MKKLILTLLIVLALGLSACTSSSSVAATQATVATQAATAAASNSTAASAASSPSASLNMNYTNAASVETQLLLGILMLQGSSNAVTAEQAKALLPLWNSLMTLQHSTGPGQAASGSSPSTSSRTDAQTQVEALVQQIQAVLSADQISAIAAMQITTDKVQSFQSDLGISMGGPGQGGSGQAPKGNPPSGNGNQPQMPQGTPPAGNGQGGMPQPGDMGGGFQPEVFNALIHYLDKVAGVTSTSNSTTSTNASSSGSAPSGAVPAGVSSSTSVTLTGATTLNGTTASEDGRTYTSISADQSAILVSDGGSLTVKCATVNKTGDSSSTDDSSFYGLNAAVLAASGSTLSMSNSTVTANAVGANGVFSTGPGSGVTLKDVTINASGNGAHAVMATQGGAMTLTDVDMTTTGAASSAIATDRGGGTITVTGGTVQTSGRNSAGIYSTGNITVSGTIFTSSGAEAAVIEGANSITLNDVSLTSTMANKWGVMIYQSMSGDASGTQGTFTMTGGSLSDTDANSPLFYVTNSTAVITLKGASLNTASGVLVKAAAGSWGNSGSNGGAVDLSADAQALTGSLTADSISVLNLTLKNGSTLTGAINAGKSAKSASLTLDAISQWTVTADSTLTTLSGAILSGSSVTNITGNGHTVYYDASNSANSALNGATYSLAGGGGLTPAK